MLDTLHVYDDREPQSAALNMAVDEALLEDAAVPILRFYRWRQPSLSFGYFGLYAEVASKSDEREIVRRWTGGGIVPHGDDLTYSVVIPASQPFFARSSPEIYAALHDAIRGALDANGVQATLASAAAPKVSENCFANAVRADVMSNGQKIAGAAHRRSRAGLLHQGSIQQSSLPERFRSDLAQALCERYEMRTLARELLERATGIAAKKYGTTEWLMRR
jgi:lipoyl(octanoyl) transferase